MIDTQSVNTARQGGPARGRDPSKQVTGRKRHAIVDTLGLLLGVIVHGANENDSQQAPRLLRQILGKVPRLQTIFADADYEGVPGGLLWRCFRWGLEIVRSEGEGFDPLPKRWVIERTFGWFEGYRRLNKDYEYLPETSEAMVRVAMNRLMLRRIA